MKLENDLSGRYLTLFLGEEIYGIDSVKVHEIISLITMTKLPRMPKYIRGVINLRGSIIPVIDMRLKCGMEAVEDTESTCIIIIEFEQNKELITIGIVVDEVCDVKDIVNSQVEKTPSIGGGIDTDYILGIATVEDKVIMILDIVKAFSREVKVDE